MRRKDREITGRENIEPILRACKTCRVAMIADGAPYVVPLNFGYTWDDDGLTLYFHSGLKGKKIDALRADPRVCFELDTEQGVTGEVVAMQTKIALGGVSAEEMSRIIIAYEPVWAIGTGRTATAEQANEVCKLIRATIAGLYGDAIADAAVIQYGGSMNAGNAAQLLAQPDVDGGLIGGASLKAPDFSTIVAAAKQ